MSRAFVKEPDGSEAFEDLPEKLISEHRNLVTPNGLARIEAEVTRLQAELASAQAANDRAQIARASRDLRYWSQRYGAAEAMPPPGDFETVQFGSRVDLVRSDGRRQSFRIVGEDEAEPAKGALSYVSPLAQALLGKRVGEEAVAGAHVFEIEHISL